MSQPVSVGNALSLAVQLYRLNFKDYFLTALAGTAWLLVPVYGWAKWLARMGYISRSAINQLTRNPEERSTAFQAADRRKWSFLMASFLGWMLFIGMIVLLAIASLVASLFGTLLGSLFALLNPVVGIVLVFVIAIVISILIWTPVLWLTSRLMLTEVPIAAGEEVTGAEAITRSWRLTSGSFWRLQGVLLVFSLLLVPLSFPTQMLSLLLYTVLGVNGALEQGNYLPISIYYVLTLPVAYGLFAPLWQTLKAVLYVDSRRYREGVGLELASSDETLVVR